MSSRLTGEVKCSKTPLQYFVHDIARITLNRIEIEHVHKNVFSIKKNPDDTQLQSNPVWASRVNTRQHCEKVTSEEDRKSQESTCNWERKLRINGSPRDSLCDERLRIICMWCVAYWKTRDCSESTVQKHDGCPIVGLDLQSYFFAVLTARVSKNAFPYSRL